MQAEAIQRIEQLALAAREYDAETIIPYVVTLAGMQVQSLEHLEQTPAFMRMQFDTRRIPDFIGYITHEQLSDDTAVYVHPTGKSALAIIDHGTQTLPQWGHHRAALELERSSMFAAVEELCSRTRTQREMIEFLEDWSGENLKTINGDWVAATNYGKTKTQAMTTDSEQAETQTIDTDSEQKEIRLANAIAAIRKVEIKEGAVVTHERDDFGAARTSLERIEAKGVSDALPNIILAKTPVYIGTEARVIGIRVGIIADKDNPGFRLRIIAKEALMDEVAADVEAYLRKELNGVRVYIGSVGKFG